MTEDARGLLLDCFTLRYYFGGCDIAYRRTDQGIEVLAVGSEIGPLLRGLPLADQRDIILSHPEPW